MSAPQGRFHGKVMVITGAAQGIGRATAERAAREGAEIVLVDLAAFLPEVAAEIGAQTGHPERICAHRADLETYRGAEGAMAAAVARFGRIDILINAVGGAIRMRPFAEFEPEQIDAEIRRSLMPTLYGCHAVLGQMIAQRAGTIINISSNATRGIHRLPYSAAKGGVNAITLSLAMEVAEHNIRVCATAPGGTEAPTRRIPRNPQGDSPAEQAWMAAAVAQVKSSSFLKRYASLSEQVEPILFLASDAASYITGTVLPVAGGDLG